VLNILEDKTSLKQPLKRQFITWWLLIRSGYIYEKEMEVCHKLVPSTTNSNVLLFGSGDGRYANLFPSAKVYGIDNDEKMIKLTKIKAPQVITVKGSVPNNVQLLESSFDIIVALRFFTHKLEDINKILSKVHTLLKKNGLLLFDVINSDSPMKLCCMLSPAQTYSSSSIERLLSVNDFRVVASMPFFAFPSIIYRFIPRWFSRLVDKLPVKSRLFYLVEKK